MFASFSTLHPPLLPDLPELNIALFEAWEVINRGMNSPVTRQCQQETYKVGSDQLEKTRGRDFHVYPQIYWQSATMGRKMQ